MVSCSTKKIVVIVGLAILVWTALKIYQHTYSDQGHIYDFSLLRDIQPVLDIFKNNWKELVGVDDYSPEQMMKERRPGNGTECAGALKIKVMREKNKLAGFAAYYMEEQDKGIVLLLAVDKNFRGKGYGKNLTQYAITDLFSMGAQRIGILVLFDNLPAKNIYKGLGFVEKFVDDNNNLYLECSVLSEQQL
jgi:ribosomal protein S18 acetylase RimI-like enzyme